MEVVPLRAQKTIPELLRELADDIEAKTYGDTTEAVVVINGHAVEVFGYGNSTDGTAAHYLLCCGASRLQAPMIKDRYRD